MNIHRAWRTICILAIVLVSASLLPLGCSRSAPVYRSSQIQLVKVQSPDGSFAERLSVFVFFDDDDGPADFGSITVTHTDSGLFWKILPDESAVRLRGKDRWTGSNNLAGPGNGPFPEGEYTLSVTDLAGNEAVNPFILTRPDFPDRAPTAFSISGGNWEVSRNDAKSAFNRIFILLYDGESRLLYSWRLPDSKEPKTKGSVASLISLARDAVTARCYTENDSGTAGVLLTPVNIR